MKNTQDNKHLLTVKQVKKQINEVVSVRMERVSVSIWQPEAKDNIDRIVIKFPRTFTDAIMLTHLTDKVLKKNGFHVAQVMGFMEKTKIWILLVRDRR